MLGFENVDRAIDILNEVRAKLEKEDKMIEISTEIVPVNYEMNPDEDDILFDGSKLRNGMVVLVESASLRDYECLCADENCASKVRQRTQARWARVSEVKLAPSIYSDVFVEFIAIYGDRVKKKRTVPLTLSWIVKKNSLPKEMQESRENLHRSHTVRVFGETREELEYAARLHGAEMFDRAETEIWVTPGYRDFPITANHDEELILEAAGRGRYAEIEVSE